MTLTSHSTHQRKPAGPLWDSSHCTRQHSSESQHSNLSRTHLMDQSRTKPHSLHSRLMFCLKNQVKMDERGDQTEHTDSRLREPALRWFTDTQTALVLQNGNVPEWFQGFISRRDTEEHLKDKQLGCFLIRLSEKATGYILSYKGRDRCRHFVINQNNEGRFIVTGDTETHDTLTGLIEYYKSRPIEPFGEYLTSSCFESSTGELYDVIHADLKGKAGVSVKAVRSIWDRECLKADEILQRPALPPKSHRNPQAAPPVVRKSPPPKTALLEVKPHQENVLYTAMDLQRPRERSRTPTEGKDISPTEPRGHRLQKGLTMDEGTIYSELMVPNCRSQSLPLLDGDVEGDVCCHRRSQPQLSSHSQLKHSLTSALPGLSSSLDKLCHTSRCQLAGTHGQRMSKVDVQRNEVTYAKVPHKPNSRPTARAPENSTHTDTYEMLTDPKPKQAEKWKWLSPEKHWKK